MAEAIPIEKILELLEIRRLSVPEIAVRLGITRQGVYYRLRKEGFKRDPRKRSNYLALDKRKLEQLYGQALPISEIARRLRTGPNIVRRELKYHEIPKRKPLNGRRYKCPELKDIKVGGTMIVKVPKDRPPHFGYLYKPAKKLGMKITIHKQSERKYKLTRIS